MPTTFVTVSLTLGMYLFAYRPEDAPPASNPPGIEDERGLTGATASAE